MVQGQKSLTIKLLKIMKKIISFKVVRYTYGKKHDAGLLVAAFNEKSLAEKFKLDAIQQTKFEKETYIYQVENVYSHTDFMEFLGVTNSGDKHIFNAPENDKGSRFCICGKYLTDDIHLRN